MDLGADRHVASAFSKWQAANQPAPVQAFALRSSFPSAERMQLRRLSLSNGLLK
jgi:hypothetical protein